MGAPDPLLARALALGVQPAYEDTEGRARESPRATVEALVGALGEVEAAAGRPGGMDGGAAAAAGLAGQRLPRDPYRGEAGALSRCHLPADLRAWGWSAQLYGARSRDSWGIGDLGDLRTLARWAAGQGAGFVAANPLHAVLPTLPQQASPYFPSSRRFRNPLYIRVEDVPGFGALATDLAPVAAAGRALNHAALIDRDAIHQLKMGALERLWNAWPAAPAADRAALSAFVAAAGPPLSAFATFNALAEREAGTWRSWPEALRRPATASLSGEAAARAGFHAWLQWLLDRQLAAAGRELPLVQDLAVGVDPAGADAWEWQDVLIPGFHVGAPPDEFNLRGQAWGFPAFDPGRLAALGGAPLAAVFAAAMRHSGGLRVDHVMALFRLWLIPDGGGPADGVYLTYPAALLLDVLAEASRAARAWVVGEDLGTVEPGVRHALAARGVLSSRLLWFEAAPPEAYPAQAMAALTTHDLPTVAGLWTGDDLRAQRAAGMVANESGAAALRDRLAGLTGLAPDADPAEAVARAYAVLAQAPSMLLAAGLEDATVERRRPNLPGTTDQWPNWRIPLAVPVEELDAAPAAAAIARALRRE